jgi:hypothetical protein
MILLFTNKIKNVELQFEEELGATKIPTIEEFAPPLQQTVLAFFTPHEQPNPTCSYPMNIEELFPFWLRHASDVSSNLILMTKEYYNWLTCGINENDISFFNLENLIDVENIPNKLIKYQLYSYINSFKTEYIQSSDNPQGNIDPEKVKKLLDNVKINLYTKKGTEESVRYVLESLFNIQPNKISVSYPKRFVLRLNGGHYDWMRDDLKNIGQYSSNPNSYNPQLTGSFLNYSVLQDNDLWQEYSYVLNIAGLTAGQYENVVRPLVHPAGTKDFYDVMHDVFSNAGDSTANLYIELPVIKNYAKYNLLDFETMSPCFGCSGSSDNPGPQFVFPSWDIDINSKYPSGVVFGDIEIGDFLRLSPAVGFTFPNENITCTGC